MRLFTDFRSRQRAEYNKGDTYIRDLRHTEYARVLHRYVSELTGTKFS